MAANDKHIPKKNGSTDRGEPSKKKMNKRGLLKVTINPMKLYLT